jgi:hypothetical protein
VIQKRTTSIALPPAAHRCCNEPLVGKASQHFHLKPMCDHKQMPSNAARLAGKQL